MRRISLLFLVILAILVLSTCEEFDPQWAGKWVATVDTAVITLDLGKWEGTLTVENSDPPPEGATLTIVEGELDGDENTIIAEITSIYREFQDYPDETIDNPFFIILYITCPPDPNEFPGCLGLDYPCSASYTIEGDTITLTGDLILALTNKATNTLIATKL